MENFFYIKTNQAKEKEKLRDMLRKNIINRKKMKSSFHSRFKNRAIFNCNFL